MATNKNRNIPILATQIDEAEIDSLLIDMEPEERTSHYRTDQKDILQTELLQHMAENLQHSLSAIQDLLANSDSIHSSAYIQRCWDALAMDIYWNEQILWNIYDASWIRRSDVLQRLSSCNELMAADYEIQHHGSTTVIRCPRLSIQFNHQTSFVEDVLLSKLAHTTGLPQYQTAHVTFWHVYPEGNSVIPKDVGNFNYRRLIDLLAVFFGFSDSAYCYAMSMAAIFSDAIIPGTYILIEEKPKYDNMSNFLADHFPAKS